MHVFVHVICSVMSDFLCHLPGSSVHVILQVRILEWVVIPFSRDLPDPGIKPRSPALQADSLPAEPQGKPLKNFIYLLLAVLDLRCCSGLSLVVASRGCSVAVMCGLLVAVASLVKHGP